MIVYYMCAPGQRVNHSIGDVCLRFFTNGPVCRYQVLTSACLYLFQLAYAIQFVKPRYNCVCVWGEGGGGTTSCMHWEIDCKMSVSICVNCVASGRVYLCTLCGHWACLSVYTVWPVGVSICVHCVASGHVYLCTRCGQ